MCKQPFCVSPSPMRNDKTKGERNITKLCKTKEKRKIRPGDKIEKTIATLERTLEDQIIEGQLREKLLDVLKSKKEQHEKTIEYGTKGAILRSRSRWYNEGQKNTKYFLNLEKRHYKQGTISAYLLK